MVYISLFVVLGAHNRHTVCVCMYCMRIKRNICFDITIFLYLIAEKLRRLGAQDHHALPCAGLQGELAEPPRG